MQAASRRAFGPILFALLLLGASLPGCKAGLGAPCSATAPCAAGQQCSSGQCVLCDPQSPPQPTLTCAPDQTLECSGGGAATARLVFTEQAGCNLPAITDTLGLTSFPLGTTSVPFSAKDGDSLAASCTTRVTVVDTTPPALTCPAVITAECTGNQSARVNPGQATATDACGPVSFVYKPATGDYPLGTTEAATAVKDVSGNTATCTQVIKVVDTTPPSLTCPDTITAECTGNQSARVNPGQATATDACGPVSFVYKPATGDYPLGTTEAATAVKDVGGNTATCTQTIKVVDTTPPALTCPDTITAECTGNQSAHVNPGQATATDACGTVSFVYKPAAGDYPLGTTEAATAVKDPGGNTATCTQVIKVVDTTPPSITCPGPITVECTGGKARINPGRATATDSCSTVVVTNAAQGDYPRGVTQATYSAKDQAGNVAACSQTVTVQDTSAPVVTCGAPDAPAKSIPQDGELFTLDLLADCQLSVADTCDGAITPAASNTSAGCVTVNQGPSRSSGADVEFIDATHVKVWPGSPGGGNRVYRIPVAVKDSSGNSGTAVCRVLAGLSGPGGFDDGTVAQTFCPGAVPAACTPQTCSAFVYAGGGAGGVHGYSLDQSTGAVAELASSPFPIPSLRLAAHPTRPLLYVTDPAGQVGAFAVAHDGSLTQVGQSRPTGSFPEAATVNPAGTFLYVGNVYGGGTTIYPLDPRTGGLGASASLDSGSYNHGGVFDPTGHWFYLSRNNSNDVTRYLADASTGALTSGVTLSAAGGYHEAMDPQGRYLYVSDWDKSGGDKLSAYAIGSDGTLTRVGDYATGGGNPAGVAVTPDGRFVYVVNASSGTISGFSVGGGGALAALAGSPFALGDGAWELSMDPSGKRLFAGHGPLLATFAIDGTSGALAPLGTPLTGNGASPGVGASVVLLVP